jgi:hypothetical protein
VDEGPLLPAKGAAASPVLIRGLVWAPDSAPGRLTGKGRICFAGKAESERITIDREEWRRRRGTGFRALAVVSYTVSTYTVGAWIYAWLQGA